MLPKHKQKSLLKETLENKEKTPEESEKNFKVSFEHYDSSQKYGSSFQDWEKTGLLSHTLDVLHGYCCSPLKKDGDKFAIYGDFPASDKNLGNYIQFYTKIIL